MVFVYISFSIVLGFLISGIFFRRIEKRNIQEYKNKYISYEKSLDLSLKNLKNESILRVDVEKKLQHELQMACELHGKLAVAEERLKLLDYYEKKCEKINYELNMQLNFNNEQKLELNALRIRFEEYKLSIKEKEKFLANEEERFRMQFENLSNRIFEQNRYKVNEQNKLTLNSVLNPLMDQLNSFKSQIQDNFFKSEQTRHALTCEIHNLHQLNVKITQETLNLTRALKGNNKVQGNWGEVILERALEASGMREGHEFHLQINIKQIDGRKLQPDAIVHLPSGKDVIIDSKISLIAYERYFNSDDDQVRRVAINDHIQSLRAHIKLLHKKDYQKLFGLNTLDYILMFIPIESAFTVAIEKESSLLTEAMNCNIMLVSPTTLLIALRTINNLWRYEYQDRHAKKISEKASRLYDKLRLFVEDFVKIGQYLNKSVSVYNLAKNKFSEGKGNIISQAESFRELGVQVKNPIVSNHIISQDIFLSQNQCTDEFDKSK